MTLLSFFSTTSPCGSFSYISFIVVFVPEIMILWLLLLLPLGSRYFLACACLIACQVCYGPIRLVLRLFVWFDCYLCSFLCGVKTANYLFLCRIFRINRSFSFIFIT